MAENRSGVVARVKRLIEPTKSLNNTWPFIGPAFAICGALLWGSAMVFASMYARLPVPITSARTFLVVLGALAGLFVACGAFGHPNRHVLLWLVILLGGLLVGGLSVVPLGVHSTTRIADDARQAFVDERHDFASSRGAFPYLAATARELWKVDVELDEADGPAAGGASSESDGSAATSEVHNGFCVLGLQPRMAERYVGAAEDPAYRQDLLWVASAREIGRCVDVSRDESLLLSGRTAFKSLAPADSFGISTPHDYFQATQRPTTRQWRDRYADAFAVGWMRLAKPEYARQLADNLRHDQELAAGDVNAPDPGCAVVAAMKANAPTSLDALPAWADQIRSSACSR